MVFDYLGALSVPAIMEGKLDLDIGAALKAAPSLGIVGS